MMSLPAASASDPPPVAVIAAPIEMASAASSFNELFVDHVTGANTARFPASAPGLPASPVEMTTLDSLS